MEKAYHLSKRDYIQSLMSEDDDDDDLNLPSIFGNYNLSNSASSIFQPQTITSTLPPSPLQLQQPSVLKIKQK